MNKDKECLNLSLNELENGVVLIKGFIEDLRHSVMGYMVTSHPDYDSINRILDNLRLVVSWEKEVKVDYGHTHETNDWRPIL